MKYFKGCTVASAFAVVGLVASNAHAVLSVDQQAAADSITALITDLSAWGWSAIILLIGFTIGAKLFKKVMNRAT